MTQIYLTTTGTESTVVLDGFIFNHPCVDCELLYPQGFMSLEEFRTSASFPAALSAGSITLKDENDNPIEDDNDIPGSGGGIPYFDFAEKTTFQSTTSMSTTYLSKTFTVPSDGSYTINWHIVFRANSTSRNARFRCDIDNSVLVTNPGGDGYLQIEVKDKGSDIRIPLQGTRTLDLTSGDIDVRLKFGSEDDDEYVSAYYGFIGITRVI